MQIYVTSYCPIRSAEALDDRRLNESIINVSQILSTSLWINKVEGPYKKIGEKSPLVKWTSRNYKNYLWVLDHLISLHEERRWRFAKSHESRKHLYELLQKRDKIPVLVDMRQPFENASMFKDVLNVIKAYRMTLDYKWENDNPKWTGREPPVWSNLNKISLDI